VPQCRANRGACRLVPPQIRYDFVVGFAVVAFDVGFVVVAVLDGFVVVAVVGFTVVAVVVGSVVVAVLVGSDIVAVIVGFILTKAVIRSLPGLWPPVFLSSCKNRTRVHVKHYHRSVTSGLFATLEAEFPQLPVRTKLIEAVTVQVK